MKKTLLNLICFLAGIVSIQAQILFGTTPTGGKDGGGTINKFIPAANNLTVAKSFESIGGGPGKGFIQGSDGKLYGMSDRGGSNNAGIIFSFDPSSSTCITLKNFDERGNIPVGSLVQASDGKLYGMTANVESSGAGVIFSFDLSSSTYTKLKDFGGTPLGSLMQASDGKLYGMTANGGSSNGGVIFSFDPSSSIYTKLKDFDGINGASPVGNLMQASDGKLYGMTNSGGSSSAGVIFSFDPSASTYTKLKDFDYTDGDGAAPNGSLMEASDGKIYGMTTYTYSGRTGPDGPGVIFSYDLSSSTYTKLKDFDYTNGANPAGSLMQASDGKLYGTTQNGGSNGGGVIFSVDPSSSTYTKLKDFDGINGASPTGSLLQASDGKLYGTTTQGGSRFDFGVIFSFDPSASTYTKLKDGGTNETGTNVSGSLVQASDGKLYGTTAKGGSNGLGVIFSFYPSSSTYTKLKEDFDGTMGSYPFGSLVQASDGKLLYGTAVGGSSGAVIFSFDPSSSTYTKLANLNDGIGSSLTGSLIQASDGKLYGMTGGSRTDGYGSIFSFDPSSSTFKTIYSFYGGGIFPTGGLMQARDGKLYGMTQNTGVNENREFVGNGVIFSYDLSSSTYTNLKDFAGTDGGGNPGGSLVQASDGKLYGITGGGSNSLGIIFSFDPSSSTYTKLKDFDNTNGASPVGSLMQASDGKLYGATYGGGSSGLGVIFSFDPSSSTYTKLQDYTGANGANPSYGSAFIEVKQRGDGGYCSAGGNCSNKGFIKNVFACYSFNNTTGCTGYGNYASKALNTAAGRLLGFSVTPGYNSCTYQPLVYIRAWIDWNGDGDFTDAGEMVFAPHTPVNVKSKFWVRVPAGTSAGRKRMRVTVSADYKFSSCGTIANGDVEDYTINVLAARFAVPDATPDAFDEAGESFTIYPNPVQQKMIIERSGYDEGKASNAPALMVLTNANGKTLLQKRLTSLVQAVDVSKLASGVYFVTIINGKNKTTNKIIINQ